MKNEELKNKDSELVEKFGKWIVDALEEDDCNNNRNSFEEINNQFLRDLGHTTISYFDNYKTLDEFIDYIKNGYINLCEQDECEEYGHEDLWDDIYYKYRFDFISIYNGWKDDFEEEKEKFFLEQIGGFICDRSKYDFYNIDSNRELFETKYVLNSDHYEKQPLSYYDEYKTFDEFVDYVKSGFRNYHDNLKSISYSEELWEKAFKKYDYVLVDIYNEWKQDFEEQKEQFFKEQEQDNSPSMKM